MPQLFELLSRRLLRLMRHQWLWGSYRGGATHAGPSAVHPAPATSSPVPVRAAGDEIRLLVLGYPNDSRRRVPAGQHTGTLRLQTLSHLVNLTDLSQEAFPDLLREYRERLRLATRLGYSTPASSSTYARSPAPQPACWPFAACATSGTRWAGSAAAQPAPARWASSPKSWRRCTPELVSTDEDGYKSVNYAQFTLVLLEALKEQQQQIAALKQEAARATATLDTFEARLRQLEATSSGQARK